MSIKLTKEQLKKILKRMESNGASFVQFDTELKSYDLGDSWEEKILVRSYAKDGKYLRTIMRIK